MNNHPKQFISRREMFRNIGRNLALGGLGFFTFSQLTTKADPDRQEAASGGAECQVRRRDLRPL